MTQGRDTSSTIQPSKAPGKWAKRHGDYIVRPLTTLTLAALALGAVAFAYDSATAQTPSPQAACAGLDVSLYFEKGKIELNDFSKAVAERIAAEAKACGVREIVAETKVSGKRADAITRTFESMDMKVAFVGPHLMLASASDTVADRTASVRIIVNAQVG